MCIALHQAIYPFRIPYAKNKSSKVPNVLFSAFKLRKTGPVQPRFFHKFVPNCGAYLMSHPFDKIPVFDPEIHQKDAAARVVVAFERIAEAIRVALWNKARKYPLSPLQIQILLFVATHRKELCRPSKLAEHFNVRKPTISAALRALYSKGLLKRERLHEDARFQLLQLTDKGAAIVRDLLDFGQGLYEAVKAMGSAKTNQLFALLIEYIDILQQRGLINQQRMCFVCQFFEKKGQDMYCHLLAKKLLPEDLQIDCPDMVPL